MPVGPNTEPMTLKHKINMNILRGITVTFPFIWAPVQSLLILTLLHGRGLQMPLLDTWIYNFIRYNDE